MQDSITNNKRIAKNTFFLYLRMFITMAVSLYTVRVVLNVLSVQDYGLYGAVGGIILTFSFISSVLDNASQRFFSFELGKGESGRLQEIISTLTIIYLIVTIFIILLAETVGLWFLQNKMTIPEGREEAAMWVYQFALISFIVSIMATPYRALIIAHEKMTLYAYLSIFDAAAKLGIAYLLIVFNTDKLILYSILLFILHFINSLVYFAYCRRKSYATKLIWRFDKSMFNSVFSYSSWTLFGTIAGICSTQGVNLVLNVFFGPVANAAYSIATQIYNTVGAFANNFYTAVKPPLIKNYASGKYEYVHKLFMFSSKALYTLLCILAVPLMVCAPVVLQLWLGQVGDYMVSFVKLSLVYVVTITISYPITAVVQAGGNVKLYHSLVDGFALIALPIIYVLFKIGFDAYWAYIITVLTFAIAHFLRIYVLKKVFPLFDVKRYLLSAIVPMVLIFVISYFSMTYIDGLMPSGIWCRLFSFVASAALVLLLCVFVLFTKTERQMVVNMVKEWFHKRASK